MLLTIHQGLEHVLQKAGASLGLFLNFGGKVDLLCLLNFLVRVFTVNSAAIFISRETSSIAFAILLHTE